jgi:menaquinone-dependent protoporphyrinogen IX oxidase
MKGLIIYKGKYGATCQYANWLEEELHLPVVLLEEADHRKLYPLRFIVIGSSVYMGKLLIKGWLKKHASLLENKKLYIFIVGASGVSEKQKRDTIIKENLPAALRHHCEIFFLPGRLDIKKLSWKDRLLVKAGALFEKDPFKKKIMREGVDGVAKEHLIDLIYSVATSESDKKSALL